MSEVEHLKNKLRGFRFSANEMRSKANEFYADKCRILGNAHVAELDNLDGYIVDVKKAFSRREAIVEVIAEFDRIIEGDVL